MAKKAPSGLRDLDIRRALRLHLSYAHGSEPDTRIIDELGLCQGSARVDLAVINGSLNGYEIKSERDSLERLPAQQKIYSKALDTVVVVASARHVEALIKAVPPWWGIWQAEPNNTSMTLTTVHESSDNPDVDPFSVVQLLWRDEALAALEARDLDRGLRTKSREVMWSRLANAVPLPELRHLVRRYLKARRDWRSDEQQVSSDVMCLPSST